MNRELLEKILSKTLNNPNTSLIKDYIKGMQWTVDGQITRNNFIMVERPVAWKAYAWITHNVIQDAIQTMTGLIIWEYEEEYSIVTTTPEKQDLFNKINFSNYYTEVIEKLVKYWKAWVFLKRDDINDTYSFDIVSGYKVTEFDNKVYIVEKQPGKPGYSPDYKITEIAKLEDGTYIESIYFNLNLVKQTSYNLYPYYIFDVDEYITKDLIRQQDVINMKYTIEKNVELYASDPFLAITWFTPEAWQKISVWAGSVMNFEDKDTKVSRVEWVSLPSNFIELKKLALADFYRLAKLSSIKNSDLSWVTSWEGIQKKLIDTLSYVNRFRNDVKTQIIEMFNQFALETWLEELKVEKIYLAPVIWEKNKEIENEEKRIWVLQKKFELVKVLIETWYTKEEALKYIEENK